MKDHDKIGKVEFFFTYIFYTSQLFAKDDPLGEIAFNPAEILKGKLVMEKEFALEGKGVGNENPKIKVFHNLSRGGVMFLFSS